MDQTTFDILISAKPQLSGPGTPEPSLRHIVFAYYSDHIQDGMARQYTEEYFAALKRTIG